MISFVIGFSGDRIDNLNQTLRFLYRREQYLHDAEILLIAQDSYNGLVSPFRDTRIINLNNQTYCRPKMLNIGAREARYENLVLMDSDRILPTNYFYRNLEDLGRKTVITTRRLFRLLAPYTDDEIESERIKSLIDFRSYRIIMGWKNLFSGNTMILRSDYLDTGGMDEEYEGYGYADNDMTMNVRHRGYNIIYRFEDEYHLYHEYQYVYRGKLVDPQLRILLSAINMMRFCRRWGITPHFPLLRGVLESKYPYPTDLLAKFAEMKTIPFL